jgi:hypothetical protein
MKNSHPLSLDPAQMRQLGYQVIDQIVALKRHSTSSNYFGKKQAGRLPQLSEP